MDCFHEGSNFLVIDPEECIDCALCVPECPVEAIYDAADLPPELEEYIEINENLSRDWPVIDRKVDALPDAEDWADHLDAGVEEIGTIRVVRFNNKV